VARALLQALVPRIRAERVASPVYGHRCGDYAQSPADTMGDLVAECYAAIIRHAGEDHADVPRLILQEATRRLRTARQADRRYRQRTVQLDEVAGPRWASLGSRHHTADLRSARTAVEWLAEAVVEAVRRGRLSVGEARLVYGARVRGLNASELGRREGLPRRSVYYALSQAELALISAASRDLRLVVAVDTSLSPGANRLGGSTKATSRAAWEAA
jgi:DNA-directed RNA polymerase specialized sigma24 family protein